MNQLLKERLHYLIKALMITASLFSHELYAEGGSNNPMVTISPSSWIVTEGNSGYRTKTFTISISECPNRADVKVKVYTQNGSAQSGSDYVSINQSITFQSSQNCTKNYTVTVKVKGDTVAESDEKFYLKLQDNGTDTNSQSYIGGSPATITIKNDDTSNNANIRITKTNNKSSKINAGTIVTYTIKAYNDGPQPTKLKVTDSFGNNDKPHVQFISVSDNQSNFSCSFTASDKKLTCDGNRVFDAGENVKITVKYKILDNRRSTLRNNARVYSVPSKPDNNTNNNKAYSEVKTNTYDTRVEKRIQNGNGKWRTERSNVSVGDTIKYRLIIYNKQAHPTKLNLNDTLPSGVKLQSVSVSGVPNFGCNANIAANKVSCTGNYKFRDVDNYPGDKATVIITAKATQNGSYYNRARIEGESTLRGTDRWSNSVRVDIDVPGGRDYLELNKNVSSPTSADGNYYVNDTVSFHITLTNHGSEGKIRFRDWLPPSGSGEQYGTTRGAFKFLSVIPDSTSKPVNCSKSGSGSNGWNSIHVQCQSVNPLTDGETIGATIQVRLKKAGHVCNRAHGYKQQEISGITTFPWRDSDRICIDVHTPKRPPNLDADNFDITVDTPVAIDLKDYTTDPDTPKSDLIYSNATGLPPGLSMDDEGTISGTYTGSGPFPKVFNITATVTDEVGLSDTDDFTITVKRPQLQATNNIYRIPLGTALSGNLLSDTTVSGGITYGPDIGVDLNVTAVTYDVAGSSLPDNNFTWSDNGAFSYQAPLQTGTIVYHYTIKDRYGQTSQADLSIEVYKPAIEAKDDSYNVAKNVAYSGNVITDNAGNGPDIVYGEGTIAAHTDPQHGTLDIQNDGSFTYTPDYGFTGTDTFQYTLRDIFGQEDNATVSFIVGAVHAEGYTDFYLVNPPQTRNVIGNFIIAGNTVECVTTNDGTENDPYSGMCDDTATANNNNRIVKYIDVDGNTTPLGQQTWNSSRASFNLPSSYDQDNGSGILWAGLFWQGSVNNRATGNVQRRAGTAYGTPYGYKEITSNEAVDMRDSGADKVLIKIDNDDHYTPVESDTFYNDLVHEEFGVVLGGYYAAFADITPLLRNRNLSVGDHTVTVANITTNEGREQNVGNYGGWTLVVIYRETFAGGSLRNISIYNGYQAIGYGGSTYVPSKEFSISGFRLPREGAVKAKVGAFVGEGEKIYGGSTTVYDTMYIKDRYANKHPVPATDPLNVFDATFDNVTRPAGNNNDISNTNGIDVDSYDVSNIMKDIRDDNPLVSTIKLGVESKDTQNGGTGSDQSDYITLSMVAFSAELYQPKLCYDYAYTQHGINFTAQHDSNSYPYIDVNRLIDLSDMTVEIFIRNQEGSDAVLRDVTLDILDINTTQAAYAFDTTNVIYPHQAFKTHIPDTLMNVAPSYIRNIPLQDINAHEYLYTYYDLTPNSRQLHLPIVGRLSMTLDLLGGIQYPINNYPLEAMPQCDDNITGYGMPPGSFNVEDAGLSNPVTNSPHYYDIPTQVVKRVGNFVIRAYDEENPNTPMPLTTMIAVTLTKMGKYAYDSASCLQAPNTISPRVWVPFVNSNPGASDTNTSYVYFNKDTLQDLIDNGFTSSSLQGDNSFTDAAQFIPTASENTAFRIYYTKYAKDQNSSDNKNRIVQISKDNGQWKINEAAKLINDTKALFGNSCPNRDMPGNIDSNCNASITGTNLLGIAQCMECLYGNDPDFICSRDNFAIRPKGLRLHIHDQNQSTHGNEQFIVQNDNPNVWNLAAGYEYQLDGNATDFYDATSPGYYAEFNSSLPDHSRTCMYQWKDIPGHTDCLYPVDQNITLAFLDGVGSTDSESNETGRYLLTLRDEEYTKVDWNLTYMGHQQNSNFFLPGRDCISGSSIVLDESEQSTSNGIHLSNVNGCEISSNVTGDSNYVDLELHFYPYGFYLDSLQYFRGPSDKPFIYINNLPTVLAEDFNMSYNINGLYYAMGYDTTRLQNFTNGCWAESTTLTLNYTRQFNWLGGEPIRTFDYTIRDYNDTNPSQIFRPAAGYNELHHVSSAADNNITFIQSSIDYKKAMAGGIAMEFSVNYPRTYDMPLNPRQIQMDDFNISFTTQPTQLYAEGINNYKIQSVKTLDRNVTFIYGRAKPNKEFYDDITGNTETTPVLVTAYCDSVLLGLNGCQNRGLDVIRLGMLGFNDQSNEASWWIVRRHNEFPTDQDGNVTLRISGTLGSVTPTLPTRLTFINGVDSNVQVTYNGVRPYTVNVGFDTSDAPANPAASHQTSRWIIFNKNAPNIPDPLYRVRFINFSGWTGQGTTGHVVGDDINTKKTERLDW